jgi:hypothetical protein
VRVRCALLLAAGCGRVGFTPTTASGGDAAVATTAATACGAFASAPATVTVSGNVFTYTSFQNTTAPIAGGTITAYGADSGTELAVTTSDSNGNYSFTYATGGQARPLRLVLTDAQYMSTTIYTGLAIHADVSNLASPMWGTSSMTSVYSDAQVTWQTSLGTVNVMVLDCSDNPIAGVVVDMQPIPGALQYIAPSGYFETDGGTATVAPYTTGVAMNVPIGLTHISATMAGAVFAPQDLEIPGGAVTMVTMHPEL